MYSRNFAAFENVSSVKLNNELRSKVNIRENTVPVKNYSDSSAYERFSNLGVSKSNDAASDESNIEASDNVVTASEVSEAVLVENVVSESTTENKFEEIAADTKVVASQKSESKHERSPLSIFGDIHKITDIFDSDFLLITLAAALIFFGNNETNDKLTPIALLAIMFL